jgi:hypothetical protein
MEDIIKNKNKNKNRADWDFRVTLQLIALIFWSNRPADGERIVTSVWILSCWADGFDPMKWEKGIFTERIFGIYL